jgi:benzil reductase ((S)-benzoin forming)
VNLYVVTGASRGIGLALVQEAAQIPEAHVLAISRSGLPSPIPGVRDTRYDLATRGGQSAAGQAVAASLAESPWKRAVLVNNAGMAEPVAPVSRLDIGMLARAFELNVIAAVALMQAFINASVKVPSRSVINMTTGAAQRAMPGWTGYCSTKAALDMASLVAASEKTGVRITSLLPGLVDTAMQDMMRDVSAADFPNVDMFHRWKSEGALQDPRDVAAKMLRLERAGRLPEGVAALSDL